MLHPAQPAVRSLVACLAIAPLVLWVSSSLGRGPAPSAKDTGHVDTPDEFKGEIDTYLDSFAGQFSPSFHGLPDYPYRPAEGWTDKISREEYPDPCYPAQPKQRVGERVYLTKRDAAEWVRIVQDFGTNELFEVIPMGDWHYAGQIVAGMPCFKTDIRAGMKLMEKLSFDASFLPVNSGSAGNQYHGALWYIVAAYNSTWDFIQNNLCLGSDFSSIYAGFLSMNCLHGIGHGFVLGYSLPDISNTNAPQPQVTDRDVFLRAEAECLKGVQEIKSSPVGSAHSCLNGVFHAMGEYSNYYDGGEFGFPCSEAVAPALCYVFLFRDGLFSQGDWRLRLLPAPEPSRIDQICVGQPTEKHVRACIHGLTGRVAMTFFVTIYLWRKALEKGEETSGFEMCEYSAYNTFESGNGEGRTPDTEMYFCKLLFSGAGQYTADPNERVTLFDWCSIVTPEPPASSGTAYYRWLSCMSGSIGFHSFLDMFGTFPPMMDVLADPCKPEDVPGQLNSTHVIDLCKISRGWTLNFPLYQMQTVYIDGL